MKTPSFKTAAIITVAASAAIWKLAPAKGPNEAPPVEAASDLKAHEWGTFTTFHWPDSRQLAWYQSPRGYGRGQQASVSDLPKFVHGNLALKAMMLAKARMETPVIYFYTDEKRKVDVTVNYSGGMITEFYPGRGPVFTQWPNLELIPPNDPAAKGLADQLLIDAKLPDNHYYEARAVPEAAFVRVEQPTAKDGKQKPAEVERFLFYRGMGEFSAGLTPRLDASGNVSIQSYNKESAIEHVWVLKSSAEEVRWEKLAEFAPYDYKAKVKPTVVSLAKMDAYSSREESIEKLEASMVAALVEEGLTSAEALAMVATWDEQWYEEPGQRLFSIPPAANIDAVLPLKISPAPAELVRVFVHRSELLSPQMVAALEKAMAPGTSPENARAGINDAQLGRFVHGAINAVGRAVGDRTESEYSSRGHAAIRKPAETAAR